MFRASTRLKVSRRVLVTRVLEEYRPEAASLSAEVFDALRSTVDSLVNEGEHGCTLHSAPPTCLLGGNVDETSLVPLVFVAHLVQELSINSPFITSIGCERSAVESTSNRPFSRSPLIISRFPGEGQ